MNEINKNLIQLSPKVQEMKQRLVNFVELECIPAEKIYHEQLGQGDQRWKVASHKSK